MLTTLLIAAIAALALAIVLGMADPVIPTPQDDAMLLENTTTKTASYSTPAKDLGAKPGGPGQRITAVVNVTAADRANSDETYTFILQDSPDNSVFTSCGPAVAVPVSGATATLGVLSVPGVVRERYYRLALTVAGTTPSVTFKAWANPLPR